MATYTIPLSNPVGTAVFVDTDSSNTSVLVVNGSGRLYSLGGDNTRNTVDVYVKGWDANSGTQPSVGTTAPNIQVPLRAGHDDDGASYGAEGWPFTNGLWIATTTDAGTAGATGPEFDVTAKVHI